MRASPRQGGQQADGQERQRGRLRHEEDIGRQVRYVGVGTDDIGQRPTGQVQVGLALQCRQSASNA